MRQTKPGKNQTKQTYYIKAHGISGSLAGPSAFSPPDGLSLFPRAFAAHYQCSPSWKCTYYKI